MCFANTANPGVTAGSVGCVAKDGSDLAVWTNGVGSPIAIAADGDHVYVGRGYGRAPIVRVGHFSGVPRRAGGGSSGSSAAHAASLGSVGYGWEWRSGIAASNRMEAVSTS